MPWILPSHGHIKVRHQVIYQVNSVKGKNAAKYLALWGEQPRITRYVPWSPFSLGSACTCVQVCVRLLGTISPCTLRPLGTRCRHMAPKGSVHGQSDPKYCRREQQQVNPTSNTKPLHPSKQKKTLGCELSLRCASAHQKQSCSEV